jgi:hypothetical protein
MNNLQKIASDISGYGFEHMSARDDGYYESNDKINYLQDYAFTAENVSSISKDEAIRIMDFLESDFCCSSDYDYMFKILGE